MEESRSREDLVLAAGPNVRIRLRVIEDAEAEYRWRTDPENAKFDGRPAYQEPFQRFLDLVGYELSYGRNDREQYAIEDHDGRHLGTVMLYNFSGGGDSAEFGITLGEESARGAGIGREAVAVFLRWIWNNRPVREIYLHALEWNERALKCFRSAGFDETARVLRNGNAFIRMDVRREWWLLWDAEGRFEFETKRAKAKSETGTVESPPVPAERR
ncbi:MAG: GNAT family N-acetyltransferase [bacterium]